MKKLTRPMALFLCIALVLSLIGCGETPVETTAAPTEPPTTAAPQLDGAALYAQGRKAVDEAANLQLSVSVYRTRKVAGEEYAESAKQTIALQGIGTESLQVTAEDSTTIGWGSVKTQEYYSDGTVRMHFDNLPFTAQMEEDQYLSRLAPAVLVDADLYGTITAEEITDGIRIRFADPTAGEDWLVPEQAELMEATASAVLNAEGVLTQTKYAVTYLYGSTEYHQEWTVDVEIPASLALSDPFTDSAEEFVSLDYIDIPWLMTRAMINVYQTRNLSYTSVDSMVSQAAGAVFTQQETLDICGKGSNAMYNYKVDISIQESTGASDGYIYEENLQKGVVEITENEGDPTTQKLTTTQIESLHTYYLDLVTDFPWTAEDLTGATATDLGSVYLLEFTGNDALGQIYQDAAAETFWGDPNFLLDLASDYRTESLTGYLSIDKYTELPVAFGFAYQGVHTVDGMEYVLSDQ